LAVVAAAGDMGRTLGRVWRGEPPDRNSTRHLPPGPATDRNCPRGVLGRPAEPPPQVAVKPQPQATTPARVQAQHKNKHSQAQTPARVQAQAYACTSTKPAQERISTSWVGTQFTEKYASQVRTLMRNITKRWSSHPKIPRGDKGIEACVFSRFCHALPSPPPLGRLQACTPLLPCSTSQGVRRSRLPSCRCAGSWTGPASPCGG